MSQAQLSSQENTLKTETFSNLEELVSSMSGFLLEVSRINQEQLHTLAYLQQRVISMESNMKEFVGTLKHVTCQSKERKL